MNVNQVPLLLFSGGLLGNPRTKETMVNLAKRPVPKALDLP